MKLGDLPTGALAAVQTVVEQKIQPESWSMGVLVAVRTVVEQTTLESWSLGVLVEGSTVVEQKMKLGSWLVGMLGEIPANNEQWHLTAWAMVVQILVENYQYGLGYLDRPPRCRVSRPVVYRFRQGPWLVHSPHSCWLWPSTRALATVAEGEGF